jgi:hypothetical protein
MEDEIEFENTRKRVTSKELKDRLNKSDLSKFEMDELFLES